jgi:phage gp36-like protein
MLVPDPKVLRALLTRYAETRFAHAQKPTEETQRALDDVSYTLCVTTSTTRVEAALATADALLEQACCARAAHAQAPDATDAVHEKSQADLAA